jgi:NADPH:quinone reductase-like Zn-dependent oxidoreductase
VTGVCSTRHAALVRRLGAEQVIDYTKQDFTRGAARYDLALQLGGTYSPAAVKKVLTPAEHSSSPSATAAAGSAPSATSSRPWPSTRWPARP